MFLQKKSGFKANEILLVDDRKDFIEPARKIGWNTYLFDPLKAQKSIREINSLLE